MAAADDMDDLIARFMDVTMCDDRGAAANHLASCHGSLDEAVGLYFAAAAEEEEEPARTERLYEDDGYLRAAPHYTPLAPPPPAPTVPSPVEEARGDTSSPVAAEEDQCPAYVVEEELEEEEDASSGPYGEPAEGEEACSVRVRFPDGRVVEEEFGAKRPVEELFRYCQSHSVGRNRRAFRLVRFAGAASEEIRRGDDATIEEVGLHCWTLHLLYVLGPRRTAALEHSQG